MPSWCLAPGLRLLKLLEDPVEILGGDARAGVGTETLTSPFACAAATSTSPPLGVNFTAFESRLKITCLIRRSSPVTTSRPPLACSVT